MMMTLMMCLVGMSFTSCEKSHDEIVKQNAEEYLLPLLNDPESYEFVDLKLIDSVLYKDNIDYEKKRTQFELLDWEHVIVVAEVIFSYKNDSSDIIKGMMEIEKNKIILSKIDSLETALGDKKNEVASYTYTFSFRGNNKLGAKILNQYIVQTEPSPNFKIINMTDDKDKVYLNPNSFPGYQEMITKYN